MTSSIVSWVIVLFTSTVVPMAICGLAILRIATRSQRNAPSMADLNRLCRGENHGEE